MLRAIVTLTSVLFLVAAGGATLGAEARSGDTARDPDPSPLAPAQGGLLPPLESLIERNQLGFAFPEVPAVLDGPPDDALVEAIDRLFGGIELGLGVEVAAIDEIAAAGDARAAWLLSDLLRFLGPSAARDAAIGGFERLTGANLSDDPVSRRSIWQSVTDHLFAWELPALPGYDGWKGRLFTLVDERWQPFFDDPDADIDWRFVSWGGVLIDDRRFGDPSPCPRGCIPALDDPAVTDAAGGDWYPDELTVFGVTVNGESRAYPKHMMEIHEMVNDELGGRRIGIPYCTLCGSAQAYFTDEVEGAEAMPILRTSGLLSRSNKVMYDLVTGSVFDTFLGHAISGPLREAGVVLEGASVVTSTWGDWKAAHPDTTIIAEDGGIGRSYPLDPLRGRDDGGPIFPIGDVDPRLPTQAKVLGVITDDGEAIAFDVESARAALDAGRAVEALGVVIMPDASGIRATRADGSEVVGHEAFWFAWSQFHPDTQVWAAP